VTKETARQKPYPVHVLPGRARIAAPGLPDNPSLWADLTGHLARLPGVCKVRGNPVSHRFLIVYNPNCLSLTQLLEEIFRFSRELPGFSSIPGNPGNIGTGPAPVNGAVPEALEPEDLPLAHQFLNVAVGGAVLVVLSIKRFTKGVSPLAESPVLFHLASATGIITGYPLLKSGLARLSGQKKITADLLMSALYLGTLLLRESVPGLLVIWLANFNSLLQAILMAGSRRLIQSKTTDGLQELELAACCKPVENTPPIPAGEQKQSLPLSPAVLYGNRIMPIAGGFAALNGLLNRSLNRSLSTLLAASPAPAGLAHPGALCAGLVLARRIGALVTEPASLTRLALADTLLLANGWGIKITVQIGSIYTFLNTEPDEAAALFFTALQQNNHPLADLFIPGPAGKREKTLEIEEAAVADTIFENEGETILLGSAEFIQSQGISVAPGIFKARRLTTLGEIPIFLASRSYLIALAGIKYQPADATASALQELNLHGVKIMAAARQPGFYSPLERATGLAAYSLQEASSLLDKLQAAGKTVVVAGAEKTSALFLKADVTIGSSQNALSGESATPGIIFARPDLEKLEQLFIISSRIALREREGVTLAALFNSIGLLLSVSGRLTPIPASLFSNLTSLIVLLNSYRLLLFSENNRTVGTIRQISGKKPLSPGEKETAACRMQPLSKVTAVLPVSQLPGEFASRTALHPSAAEPRVVRLPSSDQSVRAMSFSALEAEEVLKLLNTSITGLTREEADRRLARYGLNQLPTASPPGLLVRLLNQFKDSLVQTLLGSGIVCILLGELSDSLAILAILGFNALLGALQEHKAENSLRALKEMAVPHAQVMRNGEWQRLPSSLLTPGDIISLAAGDGVPADARILQASSFQVNESALTGESYPVGKENAPLPECGILFDCRNMVFLGTAVSKGRAIAVVTATGRETEMGKIAGMLKNEENAPTPLQVNLSVVGRKVLTGSLAVSGLVILAGVLRRQPPLFMFLTGVSLAVAAIPEGLPAIVTIALASGVHRMARKNALVRRLESVENIGGITVICTDKTGTLTKNEQVVQTAVCADKSRWDKNTDGVFIPTISRPDKSALLFLLTAGVLAGNSWREQESVDPLEKGIHMAAAEIGLSLDELRRSFSLVEESPFDTERRFMSMVYQHQTTKDFFSYVKGAPEVVIKRCTSYLTAQGPVPFTTTVRRSFAGINSRLAARALRVLAVAYRSLGPGPSGKTGADAENNLIFLGLVGMFDPPRPEVYSAIQKCRSAGVRVVMITGDQPNTALAVGRILGLAQNKEQVYTGNDLESSEDTRLAEIVRNGRIFARMLPAHKLRLVKALRQQGERVAMIGDGVNDAPAVQEADVGLVMGRTGTDVTREAADIILADDNFATVVAAVEHGRGIYDSVQRSVRYLLATNLGEIFLVLLPVLAGQPLPLLPIQLLWLNLLGDSFPALALSQDHPVRNVMNRPPREPKSSFADRDFTTLIVSRGLAIGISSLSTYWWGLKRGDLVRARTLALASVTTSQLLHALDCHQEQPSEKTDRLLSGATVSLSGGLLLAALYYPPAAGLFKTSPLGLLDWMAVGLGAGLSSALDKVLRSVLPKTARLFPLLNCAAKNAQNEKRNEGLDNKGETAL